MRITIDAAGRLIVPKRLRDELGIGAGTELTIEAVDGRLEIAVPSKVRIEQGPHGERLVADVADTLSDDDVRALVERGRR